MSLWDDYSSPDPNSDNDTKEVDDDSKEEDAFARTIDLLALFYRLGDGVQFAKFSSLLILHHVGSVLELKLQYDPNDSLSIHFYGTCVLLIVN